MHSQKTTPPSSSEKPTRRPPNPGDATDALIKRLRDGDDSDIAEEDDELPVTMPEQQNRPASPDAGIGSAARSVPPVIAQLLGTDAEGELLAVARCLHDRGKRKLTLVFHTPIGDVKSPVIWSSVDPMHLHRVKHLLLIMVRASDVTFSPRQGSEMEISFLEHRDCPRVRVLCLAPPQQLYPSVGIDLLCFLPQNASVEKQGVIHEGVPSAVSGRPSDDVDEETGEPVVHGEKSARAKLPPATGVEDFDRPREA